MSSRSSDLSGPGVRVPCRDESGPSALRVSRVGERIRIRTPTIYHRTLWTVEQARELRDVLDAALRGGGEVS
ncbi:hypothetical protein FHR84_001844 [Actinopolyspora biskrensis]|uniref:Uncharacterized protein n=1 Tax=Actinopolyspora biskrensis TaxID=1470178 RepID=A0A852YYB0_9ACTN|nr:hypothetical protein [Actinopolyspora biskrensis]NYH78519.1 hypothetical protein [Actinopolyspora biskrensis]